MSSVKMVHCCSITTPSTHMCSHACKHTNMCDGAHGAQRRHPLQILQRQQGKYLCFESITSPIFIFLSPCCYNFLPCQTNQNTKTKRRLRQRLRFSTVRFTGALLLQTSSVQRLDLCVCASDSVAVRVWAAKMVPRQLSGH